MSDPFEEIRWKIRRAQNHFDAFKALTFEFFPTDFYRVGLKQDRKKRLVLSIAEVDPPPPELGLIIGDCAHNLRSVLDHLMFYFARPTNKREERAVQFPLVSIQREFRNQAHRMPGMPRKVRAVVERLQPYHRRKWPETALLAHIQEIDNWDKHRALTTVATSIEDSSIQVALTGVTTVVRHEIFRGPLKPGTVLLRLQMGYSEKGAKVSVKPELTLEPVFGNGMSKQLRGLPVRHTLKAAGNYIEMEVLPLFEKLL